MRILTVILLTLICIGAAVAENPVSTKHFEVVLPGMPEFREKVYRTKYGKYVQEMVCTSANENYYMAGKWVLLPVGIEKQFTEDQLAVMEVEMIAKACQIPEQHVEVRRFQKDGSDNNYVVRLDLSNSTVNVLIVIIIPEAWVFLSLHSDEASEDVVSKIKAFWNNVRILPRRYIRERVDATSDGMARREAS